MTHQLYYWASLCLSPVSTKAISRLVAILLLTGQRSFTAVLPGFSLEIGSQTAQELNTKAHMFCKEQNRSGLGSATFTSILHYKEPH